MNAHVAIIGAGPAGLMAAERLAAGGAAVTVYDRMPSPARKFLMAGRGGLNITHSEPLDRFLTRYPNAAPALLAALTAFPPAAMTAWLDGLGIETFTGSSGRIFPRAMKASPLLRAWLRRLDAAGVTFALNHDWRGFAPNGSLIFDTPAGAVEINPSATILTLGGASWPRLGSNGAWTRILASDGVAIAPLTASNCGVLIPWSDHVATRFAGEPLKRIALSIAGRTVSGEAVITSTGLEGGAVYALSAAIRDALASEPQGTATLSLDLRPGMTLAEITARLSSPRGKQSAASFLRKALNLPPAATVLLREPGPLPVTAADLAVRIKTLPLTITGTTGLDRAISTAGGVRFEALDGNAMLHARPGVFVAGEMLDWDAPTGGYLLQATFATAVAAAEGAARWIAAQMEYPFSKT